MNVAIEYLLRNGRVEQMLTLPCSLFLENSRPRKKKDAVDGKVVVTLNHGYGTNAITVRQYKLANSDKDTMLADYEETVIPFDQVFSSPHVILPGYKLLEFQEPKFNHEEKQVADLPMAAIQERQYNDHVACFFNSKAMNRYRENWLWACFNHIYIPDEVQKKYGYHQAKAELQKEVVKDNKAAMKVWDFWKKQLLLNSNPAAELVFAKYYNSKFLRKVTKPAKATTMPVQMPAVPAMIDLFVPKKKAALKKVPKNNPFGWMDDDE